MIILLFKSSIIHPAVQRLGGSFGSSFAIRKQLFNSDHFTFLKFENLSSGSKVMTYAMTTLTHCGHTDKHTDLAVELTSPFGRGQLIKWQIRIFKIHWK